MAPLEQGALDFQRPSKADGSSNTTHLLQQNFKGVPFVTATNLNKQQMTATNLKREAMEECKELFSVAACSGSTGHEWIFMRHAVCRMHASLTPLSERPHSWQAAWPCYRMLAMGMGVWPQYVTRQQQC